MRRTRSDGHAPGFLGAVLVLFGWAQTAGAQQALNQMRTARGLTEARRAPIRPEVAFLYSERWRAAAGAAFGLEYTDNAGFGFPGIGGHDLILFPQADFRGAYRLTDRNQLAINSGIGYRKHIENVELDQFYIRPGTAIGFDIHGVNWRFSLQNAVAYQVDSFVDGTAQQTRGQPTFRNDASAVFTWQALENLDVALGYVHETFRPVDAFRADQRYEAEHVALEAGSGSLKLPLTLGVEGNATWRSFHQRTMFNDSTELGGGVFGEFRIRDTARFRAGAGAIHLQFADVPLVLGDTTSAYFYASLQQRLGDRVDYTVSGGRRTGGGINFQAAEVYFAEINGRLRLDDRTGISAGFGWQDGRDLARQDIEAFTFYSLNVQVTRQLGQRLSGSLGYGYLSRAGNAGVAGLEDFAQNRVLATLRYRF